MGYGGTTTALAVKINVFPCHIASLPVAINLQCHASRHKNGGYMMHIQTPIKESDIEKNESWRYDLYIRVIYTGRDQAHKKMVEALEKKRETTF